MSKLKPFFGIMRVPFLALTPACVLLGVGAAVWMGGRIDGLQVALLLAAAGAVRCRPNTPISSPISRPFPMNLKNSSRVTNYE